MMLIAVMALGMSVQTSAKKVQVPKMYIFGFAASFNDTIVHFTNVQEIDSAWIEKKNNFLQTRELYSYQLRDFLANQYTQQSKNQHQQYDLRYLEDKEFHFKTINLRDYFDDVNAAQ